MTKFLFKLSICVSICFLFKLISDTFFSGWFAGLVVVILLGYIKEKYD